MRFVMDFIAHSYLSVSQSRRACSVHARATACLIYFKSWSIKSEVIAAGDVLDFEFITRKVVNRFMYAGDDMPPRFAFRSQKGTSAVTLTIEDRERTTWTHSSTQALPLRR